MSPSKRPANDTSRPPAWLSRTAAGLLAGLVLVGALTGVGAAGTATLPTDSPAFVVELAADGDARITLVDTFDLTTDADRQAFESIRANDTLKDELRSSFYNRIQTIADTTANETGRSMEATDPRVETAVTADGARGVIGLTVEWRGLAVVTADRVIVEAPFSAGFAPDKTFVLRAPDGYVIADVTPSPATRTETDVTWSAETTFDEFRVVAERQPPGQSPTTATGTGASNPTVSDGQPGLGPVVTGLGLLGFVLLGRRLH